MGKGSARYLADKECPHCRVPFRPSHAGRIYCPKTCQYAGYTFKGERKQVVWYAPFDGYISGDVIVDGRVRRVLQHRYFMEQHLGRPLLATEVVHHVDGDGLNNRLENLQVMSAPDHARLHAAGRTYPRGRSPSLAPGAGRARAIKAAASHASTLSPDRPFRRGTKLTVDQVILMRHQRLARASTDADIGAAFGVAASTVQRICSGKKWSHVPGPLTPPRSRT